MTQSDPHSQARELYATAQDAHRQECVLSALRFCEEAAVLDPGIRGLHLLRALCLSRLGRFADALAAVRADLALDPSSVEAKALLERLTAVQAEHNARRAVPRTWGTSLDKGVVQAIEAATLRYTYRGLAMIKNPFDLAIYPLLLWNLKPATIIEIGSYNGASALWMADILGNYGLETRIYSVDLVKVSAVQHPRITFFAGSGRALGETISPEFLASVPRPLLVVDDADHIYETSKAILDFFHPHLRKDEYVVVEDGVTAVGPRQALSEFLATHADQYTVDASYCDFFGYNATWCINGYVKRIG